MTTQSNGVVTGIVSSLEDPEGLGRVQVTYPHLDNRTSNWARIASPMSGKDRGFFLLPEVDDEVLLVFELGDPRRPYVLGGLWGSTDKPPAADGKPKENNWRFIRSRSGHIIKLDDTNGKEKIEIIANDKKRKIVIDTKADKIEIVCDGGDVEVTAGGSLKIEAGSVEVKSSGAMKLEATGAMTIKGQTVNIN